MSNKPSSHWTSELVRTIQECRAENQDIRFGQLLYLLIATEDRREDAADGVSSDDYDEDFHRRLFNITNEDLVRLIESYAQTGEL